MPQLPPPIPPRTCTIVDPNDPTKVLVTCMVHGSDADAQAAQAAEAGASTAYQDLTGEAPSGNLVNS